MRRFAIIPLVPLVLLATAYAASAQAPSTSDPAGEAPVKLGPIGLTPAIVVRDIGRDNNVFNDATDPKTDFTATISPRLVVETNPGPLKFNWTTSTDYVYYQTYASERGTNYGNSLRADFKLGAFEPSVSAGFGNTRERLNREIDVRARHHDRAYAASLRVKLFESVFATTGVRHTETLFDPGAEFRGEALDTTLNGKNDAIDAGAGVELTPLTSLAVNVAREQARFDLSPDRDSETWRVMPTVTFSPLAALSGSASLGYRRFTAHSPTVPDYKGFVSNVTLNTTVLEHHRFDVNFTRDLQYSYEADVAEYLETGVSGGWNWQVAGPIDFHLSGGRSRLHYRSPNLTDGRTDDIVHSWAFSLGWRINGQLRAGFNGDWRGRDSDRSVDRTYNNRRIYASLTWGKV